MNEHILSFPGRRGLFCAVLLLAACGQASGPDGIKGAALGSEPQQLRFAPAPALSLNQQTTVSASASSGLAVRYSSQTPGICTVDGSSGQVRALTPGACVISAQQSGDTRWAAANAELTLPVQFEQTQTITFGDAPALRVGSIGTVLATASSGLPVRYSSLSSDTCRVAETTGRVTALEAGACQIAADQPGNAHYPAAARVTLTLTVEAAGPLTTPGTPGMVTATAGREANTVEIDIGKLDSGGVALSGFQIRSEPSGVDQTVAQLPATIRCPATGCAGLAWAVSATSSGGRGPFAAPVDTITPYQVVVKFREPDYAHDMTEFHGSFLYNATRRQVSALHGELSEVMAGNNLPNQPFPDGMPLLSLQHQLSSIPAPASAGNGLLVTTFLLDHTNTLSNDPRDGGRDGWTPGTGGWKHWGYNHGTRSSPNPGNAYVRIFVNTDDPAQPLTQAQLDTLAYADCAPEGMMGDDCMTGTTAAGYGTSGSMRGYPLSQTVTRKP
ncbi:MAG: hypothetical protein Q4B17_04965 [Lautropia sp.]|nr:hypothetical protein [Lautropia sp.]